jgi:predicted nucleic-acid-binding Zn-ribbon protein
MITKCPECGSSDIVSDLPVYTDDTVSGGKPAYVKLVEPKPQKPPFLWMAAEAKTGFLAAICGACGHTQLYAEDHAEILEAHQKGFTAQT